MAQAPVDSAARIRGLDALRGFALLGILIANVRQMFWPWDIADFPVAIGRGERLAWVDWQTFHALVDLKFITLFSLLFGIGFALQGERITARGGGFAAIYLRRILFLAVFGLAHALLLYPAEVLLPYAVGGLLLLAVRKVSTDNLYRFGLVLLGASILWGYQLGALGRAYALISGLTVLLLAGVVAVLWPRSWRLALAGAALVVLASGVVLTQRFHAVPAEHSAATEYRDAQQQLVAIHADDAAAWPEEIAVRRAGTFGALLSLHMRQYADILLYFGILVLWRTLGLFMIGAALFRSGVLGRSGPADWRRVAVLGLGIGLPLSVLATGWQERDMLGLTDARFPEFLHTFSAFPLAAGMAGAVLLAHRRRSLAWLWVRVEASGRMALTNYVGQSLVLAALAETWGLGLYAQLGGPALTGLAILVYASLALLSHAWLERFLMGPLEWLWRCGTYWQWLPNRR